MTSTTSSELYYDPFDFEIDDDPYPVWKRLRDEAPLYYNERYDFFALSRFHDVEDGLKDWKTYSSAKGTLLELIKADIEMPPGTFIFEDPPAHDLHRGLLSRVFTPRQHGRHRTRRSGSSALAASTRWSAPTASTSSPTSAPQMPMRTIGMLLGIPEPTRWRCATRSTTG